MRKIFLKFINEDEEKNYQGVMKPLILKEFDYLFKVQFIFILFMSFYNITFNYSVMSLSTFIFMVGLFIFLLFAKKYCVKYFGIVIIIFFSFIGFIFVELIKSCASQTTTLSLMLPFQLFLCMILLLKANWMYCWSIYIVNVCYLVVRVFDFNGKSIAIETIGVGFCLINFGLISYKNEKTNREYFKMWFDSTQNLQQFKSVLNSFLPIPILIANYENERIEFCNKKFSNFMTKFSDVQENKNKNVKLPLKINLREELISPIYDEETLETNNSLKAFDEMLNTKFKIIDNNKIGGFASLSLSNQLREFSRTYNSQKTQEFLSIHISVCDNSKNNFYNKDSPNLNKRFYEIKGTKIKWGDQYCFLLIFNNLTKAKRITEMKEINQYKNQMLATVSHDLRTPLNGIIGMVTSVFSNIEDQENKKLLLIALRSASLLDFLINDILDLSQILYKQLRLNIERININNLIMEMYDLVEFQANKKKLELKLDIDIMNPTYIYSDPTRIKQILLNLLNNAIKFTSTGSVLLKVVNLGEVSKTNIFKFIVQDTGVGMKQEDISKLFILFGKISDRKKEIKTNSTGIGLGLTISQNLAQLLYKGEDSGINVESNFGEGSIFWFKVDVGKEEFYNEEDFFEFEKKDFTASLKKYETFSTLSFPTYLDSSCLKKVPKKEFIAYENKISHIRILIVDDDPINVMILEKYLQFFKLNYLTAMNGKEAVEIVETEVLKNNKEISAILMDCNMPIMNGFQATEAILKILALNNRPKIPIIAVTANVTNEEMDHCLKCGMIKYLPKPVKRKDLGETLQNLLKLDIY